jgi:hypothetical protein
MTAKRDRRISINTARTERQNGQENFRVAASRLHSRQQPVSTTSAQRQLPTPLSTLNGPPDSGSVNPSSRSWSPPGVRCPGWRSVDRVGVRAPPPASGQHRPLVGIRPVCPTSWPGRRMNRDARRTRSSSTTSTSCVHATRTAPTSTIGGRRRSRCWNLLSGRRESNPRSQFGRLPSDWVSWRPTKENRGPGGRWLTVVDRS